MLSADGKPLDPSVPNPSALVTTRPEAWAGFAIDWKVSVPPEIVYIGSFEGHDPLEALIVHVYGSRFERTDCVVKGLPDSDGFFIEFYVLWKQRGADWQLQRLLQRGTETHCAVFEPDDVVSPSYALRRNPHKRRRKPQWVASEGRWPTLNRVPMLFLGQVLLPENEVTRHFFSWAESIFVFFSEGKNGVDFKITTQDVGVQSLEEHYDKEASDWSDGSFR